MHGGCWKFHVKSPHKYITGIGQNCHLWQMPVAQRPSFSLKSLWSGSCKPNSESLIHHALDLDFSYSYHTSQIHTKPQWGPHKSSASASNGCFKCRRWFLKVWICFHYCCFLLGKLTQFASEEATVFLNHILWLLTNNSFNLSQREQNDSVMQLIQADSSKLWSTFLVNINWQCDYVPSKQECPLEWLRKYLPSVITI